MESLFDAPQNGGVTEVVDAPAADNKPAEEVAVEYPKWMSSLPDDLKRDPDLAAYTSIGDAFKALKSAKVDGGSTIPDESKSAEGGEETGEVPEAPDGYSLTDKLPDVIPDKKGFDEVSRTMFHEAKLTQQQAELLFNRYIELVDKGGKMQAEATQKAMEQAVNALKDEWKGDTFKENVARVERTFKELAPAALKPEVERLLEQKVDGMRLGDHPSFLKWFHAISKNVLDDNASVRDMGQSVLSDEQKAAIMFPSMKKT